MLALAVGSAYCEVDVHCFYSMRTLTKHVFEGGVQGETGFTPIFIELAQCVIIGEYCV